MSKNESRQERKKNDNSGKNQSNISKVYYWVIGILFLVLLVLVFFIFSRSGDDVNISEGEDQSAVVDDTESDTDETQDSETSSDSDANSDEDNTDSNNDEDTQDENQENTNDSEESTGDIDDSNEDQDSDNADSEENNEDESEDEESTAVDSDAPLNESHTVDYSEGSADRVEIKQRVMEVTGLNDDLIEHWIGNNGPGRVVATVSSRDQTEKYEVYLQYGDGSWHVTNYRQLD